MSRPTIINPHTKKPIDFSFEIGDRYDKADASYVYLITVPKKEDRFEISLGSIRESIVGLDTWGDYIDDAFENDSLSDKLGWWPGPVSRDADYKNPFVYLTSGEFALFFEEELTSSEIDTLNTRLAEYMKERKIGNYYAMFMETQQPALSLAIVETSSLSI